MLTRVLFEPGALCADARRVLAEEFPTLTVLEAPRAREPGDVSIDADTWRAPPVSFFEIDRRLDVLAGPAPKALRIRGAHAALRSVSVLSRAQRLVRRQNDGGTWTDPILAVLEGLFEAAGLERPLVRADLDHALDAWQWLLRIEPDAPMPLQIACLFHDIERLESEADTRIEHRAADYQAFKDAHAARGAGIVRTRLAAAPLPAAWVEEAARLVEGHERAGEAAAALADADALSFFSLNSPGYLDYFGPEQTEKKIAYTLARMRPASRARALTLCLREDVARLVERVERVERGAAGREAPGASAGREERP